MDEARKTASFFFAIDVEKPNRAAKADHSDATTEKGRYLLDENKKKLIQARHRLEEAQARDRVKERKARTRRLIQKGAIVEKAFPQTADMGLDELENYL